MVAPFWSCFVTRAPVLFGLLFHKRRDRPPCRSATLCCAASSTLVLLDRDGVINRDVGSPGVTDLADFSLIPCSARAVGRLHRMGCSTALVTNQSCVGKGLLSRSGLDDVHRRMNDMLRSEDIDAAIESIYVCTSTRESGDLRMKPHPGMILEAVEKFRPGGSFFFVGDTVTDLQAASRASTLTGKNVRRILVSTGYGRSVMGGRTPTDPVFLGTAEAALEYTGGHDERAAAVLEEICPFLYVQDLGGAVDWLLEESHA
eukprot:CAMPEP_0194288980 /NCGR_PEP_ID=MMETSP0169-20130528/38104_1 /TAXON_ID=218684 /ORGANISM="Corethron pennatum, Strain L29A3" /LENGTH=258 /DNA_ID=CAMNT_0039036141 /DNA_START=246 /DNA_END=1022 /DNA_ORIENTATION=-